jgi:signal transduction histidine kinase
MKGLVILCVDDKDIVLKISKQESEHTLRSNKYIIKINGGRILVKSEVGQGMMFSVRLPAKGE